MLHFALPSLLLLLAAPRAQEPKPATQPVRITGRTLTYEGIPIADVAIACAERASLTTRDLLAEPGATTAADGTFELTVEVDPSKAATVYLHAAGQGLAAVARRIAWKREPGEDGRAGDNGVPLAAETDVGDIVLTKGRTLMGRVRDAEGRPLADVLVVATDLFRQNNSPFLTGAPSGFYSSALTDASGIFRLPCALPVGVMLEFSHDGYGRTWRQPVAAGTPLEVTLHPTGWVQGRVLDAEGHSVEGARVSISYELRSHGESVRSGPAGEFRIPLDRPGRYRIKAVLASDGPAITGYSPVLTQPRENLEILLPPEPEQGDRPKIPVRAVTRDGKPVREFRAVATWQDYANQNANYREYLFENALRSRAAESTDGTALVAGPGEHESSTGAIRIVAPGFAPATRTGVEWEEPDEGQEPEPLVLELDPEATIRGVVRDEGTGKPIPGARFRATRKPIPNMGLFTQGNQKWESAGEDGTFEITGLGEGEWLIFVEDDEHPQAPPTDVTLKAGEHRTDVVITLPTGATVRGRITGLPLTDGIRVFLAPIPRRYFGPNQNPMFFGSSSQNGKNRTDEVEVAEDGSFAITGVGLGNHELVVRLPSEPRRGGDLYLPIEPFRVRAEGIDRVFDCSEDRPGALEGRISFSAASVPLDRIVVVAQTLPNPQQMPGYNPIAQRYPGPRSFVARDGRYHLRLAAGFYRLAALDLATSAPLYLGEAPIEIQPGKTKTRDLALRLAKVEVALRPPEGAETMAPVERLEVRFLPKKMAEQGNLFGGNDRYDSRRGLWLDGATDIVLALPEGNATFLGRNSIGELRIDPQRGQNDPFGRVELEIELAPEKEGANRCVLEIEPPRPIPNADGSFDEEPEEGEDENGKEEEKKGVAAQADSDKAPARGERLEKK